MSRLFYYILHSPADFFNEACKLSPSMLYPHSHGYDVLKKMIVSRDGEFHGSWEKTLKTFKESSFETTAALTDAIVNDLTTVTLNEVKWKFLTHLEEGDEVDVDRFVSGHERCWNGTRRKTRVRNTVRIYLNAGGNCHRSASELAVSGAVGVTFAEMMESMGLSAEIWAVYYTACADSFENHYVHMIKLKSQNEYADMGLINWFLGDNAVYRNGQFRVQIYHAYQNNSDVPWGLGQSRSIDLDDLGLTASEKRSSIVVPQLFNIDRAKAWLSSVLENEKYLHRLIYRDDFVI